MGHPNLSNELNASIDAAEQAWGFAVEDLPGGSTVSIETKNTTYTLTKDNEGTFLLWGNSIYCPDPTKVTITGCTFGGSAIKLGNLFEGGYLEFVPWEGKWRNEPIRTSQIQKIRILDPDTPTNKE